MSSTQFLKNRTNWQQMKKNSVRLPAEWESQSGILITWPHINSDWASILDEIEPVYIALSVAITRFQKLLIIAYDETHLNHINSLLNNAKVDTSKTIITIEKTNDTWTRDYGPITLRNNNKNIIANFTFNGWGKKFDAQLDNTLTAKLVEKKCLTSDSVNHFNFVLEGGSIESDGCGTLLTTSACLLTDTRNPEYDKDNIESFLKTALRIDKILWLDHGYLAGDDTDSHIDMIARFTDENTIVYIKCDDRDDEHFEALAAMESQLKTFSNIDGEPYRLISLPLPKATYDSEDNRRLPASYANFLIINGAVLVPVYGVEEDQSAVDILQGCFPNREIIGIDFSAAIKQSGSLHCLTMQLPEGLLC